MSILRKHWIVVVVAVVALLFGSVRGLRAGVVELPKAPRCRDLTVIKNLTGLKTQHVCGRMAAPNGPAKGELKKLTATAETSEDHLAVARLFRADANGFDAKAAAYELAATRLRNRPAVKNLISPPTASRLEFAASGFRDQAKTDRASAVSHEGMAKALLAATQ